MYNAGNNGNNDDDSDESGSGWISWFCDLEGHEFFIEVSFNKKMQSFDQEGTLGA